MSNRTYTSEEAYAILSLTDESDGDVSQSGSGSVYQPSVDDSGTLSDSSDDRVVVPAKVRRTRPLSGVAEVQEPQGSRMEQRASTSTATPSGDLASTSGLVRIARRRTSTAVARGDVASPISAVQAGVASTSSVPQPRRRRQARRTHSALPAAYANPNWQPPTSAAPVLPPFTGQPGIQVETVDFRPLDFLSLFLTDDLYRSIVDQSNLYAGQHFAANPHLSLARTWVPITVPEFKTFMGITLLMGIDIKPELRSYWSTNPVFYMPVFSASMGRTRYEQILRFMHFRDNELCRPRGDPEFERLYKIRPLIDHLNQRFTALFTPSKVVCVDESLIKFSGRLAFKQYLPSKRARYGVKLYKLCDRATGYTCQFRVYEGKDSHVEPEGCPDYMGSAGKIAWDLVSPLFGKGYHLYVDNYYTSVPLFSELFNHAIGACGTVRSNRRGFPQRLVDARLSQGERACLQCNNLLAMKWRDNRNVFVLTSLHPDTTVPISTPTGVVEKPLCVHKYNLNMGGVDFNDQLMAPYLIVRKARR